MAALGNAISVLQNMNFASAVNYAQFISAREYVLKSKLHLIYQYCGWIPTQIVYELCDYFQTVMAGIIAAKFFTEQSQVVLGGFIVIPLVCKSFKYLESNNKLSEAPEHMTRILGKFITTGQAIINSYQAPGLIKLLHGIMLTFTLITDLRNTKSYLKVGDAPHFLWNFDQFGQNYF